MNAKLIAGPFAAAALIACSMSTLAQTPSPTQPSPTQPNAPAAQPSPQPATPAASPPSSSTAQKTTQAASDWRSSKIVGMTVYNTAGENIGDVNDLLVSADGKVEHAVLGVGGFLGMGERLVAIPFSDLKLTRDERGNLRATVSNSRESLQSAPEFKYSDDRRS